MHKQSANISHHNKLLKAPQKQKKIRKLCKLAVKRPITTL